MLPKYNRNIIETEIKSIQVMTGHFPDLYIVFFIYYWTCSRPEYNCYDSLCT